jgi:predicted metalloendopeptidase
MRDWWVGSDGVEYEKRADVMIKQAEKFEVYGVNLKVYICLNIYIYIYIYIYICMYI